MLRAMEPPAGPQPATPPLSLSEGEKARVASNLRVCLVAGIVGSILGALANLLSGKLPHSLPIVAFGALCGLAWWLLGRGHVRAAA